MNRSMQLKARIKNLAQEMHIPAQAVLQTYMMERLLERMAVSVYKDVLVLKGGLLIASMIGISSRTTMDMDATLKGYPLTEETIQTMWVDICAIQLGDDVTLVLEHVVPIRDEDEYGGYRVAITARYESITTPLKIDITTGDVITPHAVSYTFSSNFENKEIDIWAYNIETVLAEKVETVLRRSVLNTRLRDYYDVYILVKTCSHVIDKSLFGSALIATARQRQSLDALQNKDRILAEIRTNSTMQQRWVRYCKENYYAQGIAFDDVMDVLLQIIIDL